MQCVTPMFYLYNLGEKKKGKIIPRKEVLNELNFNPNYIKEQIDLYNYKAVKSNMNHRIIQVPCNHCYACKLNKSAQKATEATLESYYYSDNYFITLTYDNENLPYKQEIQIKERNSDDIITYFNDSDLHPTLIPEHIKTFNNSLRKHFERLGHTGIKVIYCGEYGEETERPHYHEILINCPINPKYFYDFHIDTNFKTHWKTKEISDIWGKGMIDVAESEWSTVAYVARYCMKGITDLHTKEEYYNMAMYPEFMRSSINLGKRYYEEHKNEIYKTDEIIMKTIKGNIGSNKPPKLFDKWFEKEKPEEFRKIKLSRQMEGERRRKNDILLRDYTDKQKQLMEIEKISIKTNQLKRSFNQKDNEQELKERKAAIIAAAKKIYAQGII